MFNFAEVVSGSRRQMCQLLARCANFCAAGSAMPCVRVLARLQLAHAFANTGIGSTVRQVVRQVAQAAGRCAAANSLFGVKHHARAKLHTTGAQTAAACAVAN